jgi:hypothetical protein
VGLSFVGGFIRGLIVGGFALTCVSLYFGYPYAPVPEHTEIEIPEGFESTITRKDTAVQKFTPIQPTSKTPASKLTEPSVELTLNAALGMTAAPNVPDTGLIDTILPELPEPVWATSVAPSRARSATIKNALPSHPQTATQNAAPTKQKLQYGNVSDSPTPSLGAGKILVPSEPIAPKLRRDDKTTPIEEKTNIKLPTEQTD